MRDEVQCTSFSGSGPSPHPPRGSWRSELPQPVSRSATRPIHARRSLLHAGPNTAAGGWQAGWCRLDLQFSGSLSAAWTLSCMNSPPTPVQRLLPTVQNQRWHTSHSVLKRFTTDRNVTGTSQAIFAEHYTSSKWTVRRKKILQTNLCQCAYIELRVHKLLTWIDWYYAANCANWKLVSGIIEILISFLSCLFYDHECCETKENYPFDNKVVVIAIIVSWMSPSRGMAHCQSRTRMITYAR